MPLKKRIYASLNPEIVEPEFDYIDTHELIKEIGIDDDDDGYLFEE